MGFKDIFSIKYGALMLLVLQNTFLIICMRYSRIAPQTDNESPRYAASSAVVIMELVKFVTCLIVVGMENRGDSSTDLPSDSNINSKDGKRNPLSMIHNLYHGLRNEVFNKPKELALVSIPSLLYVVQNNLLYFALSHLDAATYQVGYQLKVLTTAVFSVYLLGKKLSNLQWFSLLILTLGVALTQISAESTRKGGENTTSGFVAVFLASCTSGFAGVYFEKVLKSSGTSLWMRNIQMGIPSIILGVVGTFANSNDREIISKYGFFHGYTKVVWVVILLQALGGLVVAVVVKYADNILKGFASSFSIVTSLIFCYFWLDFKPSWIFFWGAILVNVSAYLYSYEPAKKLTKDDDSSGNNNNNNNINNNNSTNSNNNSNNNSNSSSNRLNSPTHQEIDRNLIREGNINSKQEV